MGQLFITISQFCVLCACLGFVFTAHSINKTRKSRQNPPRTRLLVIRPPPGTGQPNRVLIITDPRTMPNDAGSSRREPSRTLASDPFRPSGIKREDQVVTAHRHSKGTGPNTGGGHPQSQVRRRQMGPGGQSLRDLLDDIRKSRTRSPTDTGSNIARISDTIPRAAPPVVPTDSRFGDLNMPRGIEAALKKLHQQALQLGRMREQVQGNIQLPDRKPFMNRNLLDLLRLSLSDPNPSVSSGNSGSGRFSGNVGTVDQKLDPVPIKDRGNTGSNLRQREPAVGVAGTSGVSSDKTGSQSKSIKASKKRIINSDTAVISNNGIVSPVVSSKLSETTKLNAQKVTGDTTSLNNNKALIDKAAGPSGMLSQAGNKETVNVNATAEVKASAAKAESNVTETKSVKTKNIKVTTVIKGGTAADVAAAAASQAEIANAVAQGKAINSSSIAAIAAAGRASKSTPPPVGSITVKREPNGISVITLSDGQGEPVVLRASGPVKIERIIKPNGKVQFLINPVNPTPPPGDMEIEPEDILTTTSQMSSIHNIVINDVTTIPTVPSSPSLLPSDSINPYFDQSIASTLATPNTKSVKTNKSETNVFISSPIEKTKLLKNVPETSVLDTPVLNSMIDKKLSADFISQGLKDSLAPLVNSDPSKLPGIESLQKGDHLASDVSGLGLLSEAKIPPPPELKSIFGPFDMLNSVIDFNKIIPRPSDVSVVETIPTTIKPSISKVNTLGKKVVQSTDAMPQYSLVSSSPPVKKVTKAIP